MATAEFIFDFGSPSAFLAHLALPQAEGRTGARFTCTPLLPGRVFRLAVAELGTQNMPLSPRLIDAGVGAAWRCGRIRKREAAAAPGAQEEDALMRPELVANACRALYQQPEDAWIHELDLRPRAEPWRERQGRRRIVTCRQGVTKTCEQGWLRAGAVAAADLQEGSKHQ